MVNNKLKLVKSATAFVIGAAVLTGSFAAAGSDTAFAKSSTSVKVSNGKLVYKSTGKVVKGYKTYNKALYKDGKKLTGLYKKTYYKAGKKATGTYKSVYYKTGKAFTGVTNKTYYKAGKKATGTYKNVYYKTGKAYTGVVNKTYYKAGKKATGLYKGVYYKTGKAATGIFEGQLYVSGNLNKGLYEFDKKFYYDATLANGTYTDDKGVERAFENGVEVGVKVKSVEAINAKTLKVTLNVASNLKTTDFSVTKGSIKTNIANVVIAEDKKSVSIELTSKLTKGEYTVAVAQEGKDALTSSVSVEDEKVSGISVLSEVAPFNSDKTAATVGYQVTNQYGENVTKLNASSVTASVSGAAAQAELNADGSISLKGLAKDAKEGDKVVITLVHGATATTTTKTVTLSSKAVTSEVSVGSLYNKDGKKLTQDTDLSADKFYLPVTVKDQYGKIITDSAIAKAETLITNTNPAVATFGDFEKVTIDGKDQLVLPVKNKTLAGQATVIVIAKANGTNAQGTVTVAEGVSVANVTLSAPTGLVTAGKAVLFPLSVVDNAGAEIKTKKELEALNTKNKGITLSSNAKLIEKDGVLYAEVAGGSVEENKPVTVVANTANGKVSTQTVIAKAAATPTVITGLSSKLATSLRENAKTVITVSAADLVIEDQYGQVIDAKELASTNITAVATLGEESPFTVTTNGNNVEIKLSEKQEKTADTITFKIGNSDASALSKKFSVVKDSAFASYKVEDVAPIYVVADKDGVYTIESGYEQPIVVKATTKDGEVVTLDKGADYSVTGLNAGSLKFAEGSNTATQTATITINATGDKFTKEVTYSKAVAAPVKVELVEEASDLSKELTAVTKVNIEEALNLEALVKVLDVVSTDQYGIKATADAKVDSLTFTKVSGEVTFTGNGTNAAKVTKASKDAVINVQVNVGGKSATVQVTFTAEVTPGA
ncbi:hypothetical protein BK128_04450 [Viridibacillus sp. FSL H7-0596]|uniref:hypothetical protein n=1 Tax=Viridibacillus sp. FSL H7-0596 TaxID=1928923 RepID=UPI00096FA529|nr:hypothetical protein [Viridibacillus sp. FSL H7-0596]OMC89183.1 hypothetical protein BK128_04450 [Viridibacillus sp. FSL H7-0596]